MRASRAVLHGRWLPASTLIRNGAPKAQVGHALVRLADRYLTRFRSQHARRMMLSDDVGVVHIWQHYHDCGTVGGWKFTRERRLAFADRVERFERRLGRS